MDLTTHEKELSFSDGKLKLYILDTSPYIDRELYKTIYECDAILYIFDLTKSSSLYSVRDWFIISRKHYKKSLPFLVGTKYDDFVELPESEQIEITNNSRKYAKIMKAPLIFTSSKCCINIKKLF